MAEQKINLNSATAEELTQLPGIGSKLAERIVTHRETVHPFEEPAHIEAVPGIGERTYSAIADRLAVAHAEERSASSVEDSGETREEEEGALEGSEVQGAVVPPGESISKKGSDLEELASEERWPETGEGTSEMADESQPDYEEQSAPEMAEEDESDEEERPVAEEVAVEEAPSREGPADEAGLPAGPPAARSEYAAPSRSLWSRLSWLWTAMSGGFLGMIFTLVVLAGVNGSLDIAHSRAVLSIESRIDSLVADVDALQGDVAGLRSRLNALEGLTARMDAAESAVDDLREGTTDLRERTEGLEEDVVAVSEELEVMSDAVATLQEQAGRTRDFFIRLQRMLNDVFGELGEGSAQPTPESK